MRTRRPVGCLYQKVPINTGIDYTVSCDASRPGTAWSIVQFSILNENYNAVESEAKQIRTRGGYANYAMTLSAPENARHALALIYSEDQTLVDNCVVNID